MSRLFMIALIAVALVAAGTSCSTSSINTNSGGMLQNGGMKMAAFNVEGATVGEACISRTDPQLFHSDIGRLRNEMPSEAKQKSFAELIMLEVLKRLGISGSQMNAGAPGRVYSAAVHNALAKVPNASTFVVSTVTNKYTGFLGVFGRDCVTVKGYALSITGSSVKDITR